METAVPFEIKLDAEREIVVTRYVGAMGLEERKRAVRETLARVTAGGFSRILVDTRAAEATPSTLDPYKVGEYLASQNRPAELRIASLQLPDDEQGRLVVLVSANRGVDMEVFTDPDEALGWLLE